VVLGARVLAEFGDDPTRYGHPTARKTYAGTAPITRASGTRKVVLARLARNKRLADACYRWAFSALTRSPGARAYDDQLRVRGATHHQALRAWPTAWSASSTAASDTTAPRTNAPPGHTAANKPQLDTYQPWDV
jgi:hypothetical protein